MQVDYSVIYDMWLNAEIPDSLNPSKATDSNNYLVGKRKLAGRAETAA